MKVKKVTNIQRDWVNKGEDIKDGDEVEILDEGEKVEGEYGERTVIAIKTKNGEKSMSLNQTSVNNLVDVWGDETKDWVGKEAKVWINRESVGGKMRYVAYLTAPDWVVDNEGQFSPPGGKKDDEIPVVEDGGAPPLRDEDAPVQ